MSTTAAYQDLCEYMQGQLADIGIRIKLELNQAAQHRQMVAKQQLLFFRGSWIGDYADAENYLSLIQRISHPTALITRILKTICTTGFMNRQCRKQMIQHALKFIRRWIK
jgi:hypothetical protein